MILQLRNNVLHPRKVRILRRRHTVLPTGVLLVANPILNVERRISHDVVHLGARMNIASKRVTPTLTQTGRTNGVNSQVHLRHPPRTLIEFLTINRNVAAVTLGGLQELLRLHKHATRTTAWVIQPVTMDTRPQCVVVLSDSAETGYELGIRTGAVVWKLGCLTVECPARRDPGWLP
ncbi:hypothetical protein CIP107580_02243 [Corynebacterium diphtheriae]|nr:hypothetical protein CIP107514_02254 [Corynebacterium diphtheriae]SUY76908.1 Uncharacterised protein [Corynebacterium diphtheriae bv. mitis]CAB0576691.1 hypothetical protein CIP107533_02258 [Corynebacterium diphtheriae]CAB0579079.1 hypothetical protein CIP107544_00007 [Corynebacterium diphtheriae]CAB0622073.1 hypothetical protein CIP107554_02287 [Corynebacterium diphtheriae]